MFRGSLGTSRYHRLGGGDIDRAIVHDVLIPDLLAENRLKRWELSWIEKRRHLEPQLLGIAEQLKLALGRKLNDLRAAGIEPADELEVVGVELKTRIEAGADVRVLQLSRPALSLARLRLLLRPFLDPEPAPEAGGEFVQRSSVFSPIKQALLRADLEHEDIHGVLLCGSSSLLPMVPEALVRQFPDSLQVLLGSAEQLEGAVARGAALQALSLQVLGEPLIAPVCGADISLNVVSGEVALTRVGATVPCASQTSTLLRPPRDNPFGATDIAVEVIADGKRPVGRSLWSLPAPVLTTDRLALDWRMDENQCIELQLKRIDDPDGTPFRQRFDAPITHCDSSQVRRCGKLEREEAIRNDQVPRKELGRAFEELARDCGALGEYEKALHFISLALQESGATNYLLNLRGIYREKIGNHDGAQESYQQASSWPLARFNLALLHYQAQRYDDALKQVDSAIDDDTCRSYHALRGDILDKLGKGDQARVEWQDAFAGNPEWKQLDDFELSWMERAARELKQTAMRERIAAERQRVDSEPTLNLRQGELPEYVGGADSRALR